jgi:hypothetical protein
MAKTKHGRRTKKPTRKNTRGGFWPFTSNKQQQQQQQQQKVPISINVFMDKRLSTQPNEDRDYEDVGIVHATEAVGINMGRAIVTSIANTFGSKGVDLSRYDVCRQGALNKLLKELPVGYKVSNIKMDIENGPQSIHVHAYGTLMKPKSGVNHNEEDAKEEEDEKEEIELSFSEPPMEQPQMERQVQQQVEARPMERPQMQQLQMERQVQRPQMERQVQRPQQQQPQMERQVQQVGTRPMTQI